MKLFLLQSGIGAATVLLAAVAGHYLTDAFLARSGMYPDQHDEIDKRLKRDKRQREISKWIGITERIVVAMLTMCNAIAVTVFVFATKAAVMAARLDGIEDKAEKRRTTEYVLIGTMASYFFGMLFGLLGYRAQAVAPELLKYCALDGKTAAASVTPAGGAIANEPPKTLPLANDAQTSTATVAASKVAPPARKVQRN